MSLSIVNLDTRINDIVNSKIILDSYGKERITGTKDWSYRIDVYQFDIGTGVANIVNDDTLTNVLNNTAYVPIRTMYKHLLDFSPRTDLSDLFTELNLPNTHEYLVHLNTNMLLKEELYFSVLSRTSYKSNYLNYYINFNLQTIDPKKTTSSYISNPSAASHKNYFLFNKGWNRYDFFTYYNTDSSFKTQMQINFLYNPSLATDGIDVYDTYFGDFTITNENLNLNINVYNNLTSFIDMISGFFSDTSKLFPAFTKDAQQILIKNNTYAPNSDFSLLQGTTRYTSTIKSTSYNYTWTQLNNGTSNLFLPPQTTDRTFYIDYITIQNNSATDALSNVKFSMLVNNTSINKQAFLRGQRISSLDNFQYKNIYYPIQSNVYIMPTLYTDNNTKNYTITISILEEKLIQVDVCPLQLQNIIVNNTTYTKNTFTIMDDGSVGIGTDNTIKYSLYVNDINRNKKGIFCADDITYLSDRRLKKNIEPIENALEKICRLQGVTYEKLNSNKREYGLIAQEVQEVLPECVHEIDNNGHLGIEYNKLIGIIIEAIKEIKQK